MARIILLVAFLIGSGCSSDPGFDAAASVDGGPDARLDAAVGRDAAMRDAAGLDSGPPGLDSAPPGLDAAVDAAVPCDRRRVDTSTPPVSASWRYGGGVGYPDRPPSVGTCVTGVRTRSELEAALSSAGSGDVVWIESDARIDLTSAATICIPAGVTLASDRGLGGRPGGLLFVTRTESVATLRACGDDVRVSGIRMFGSESTQCPDEWFSPGRAACTGDIAGDTNCRDCMPRSRGIRAQDVDRLEVDNCELAGWTYGAVELIRSMDDHVHHNEIHHNQRQGLGYGVVLSGIGNAAEVLIDHNRFDYNRHSVAGSGAIGQSYEARDNLVLSHANGHVFDMHGISESASWVEAMHGPIDVAGTNMRIFQNTVLPSDQYALVVRGRPTEGSWLYGNCLARTSPTTAARQSRYTGRFAVDVNPTGGAVPNAYGQSARDCEPLRFCSSSGGDGPWRYLATSSYDLSALALADFDGDRRADVFRPDGARWHWLSGGTGGWTQLNVAADTLPSLAFGDFDGDGRDDVFRATGSAWQVSDGGSGPWTGLNTSTATLGSLAFADFDADGRTDVFRTSGGQWQVSYGGSGPWTRLNASAITLASLAIHDFDGDRRADVFRTAGGEWLVSWGGTGPWSILNRSGVALESLRFADVDGDGRTDVIHPQADLWSVSYGGASGWSTLALRSLTDVAFGDFDGDGAEDVFQTGCL